MRHSINIWSNNFFFCFTSGRFGFSKRKACYLWVQWITSIQNCLQQRTSLCWTGSLGVAGAYPHCHPWKRSLSASWNWIWRRSFGRMTSWDSICNNGPQSISPHLHPMRSCNLLSVYGSLESNLVTSSTCCWLTLADTRWRRGGRNGICQGVHWGCQ